MQIKLCPKCKRPFMASQEFCPHCPAPYTWNQESWMNVGCLTLMVALPLLVMFLFWVFFFAGVFFR
ncbi:MAG: hypothetical protein ACR2HG_06165 [Pyrinomonadaceae bacterium]